MHLIGRLLELYTILSFPSHRIIPSDIYTLSYTIFHYISLSYTILYYPILYLHLSLSYSRQHHKVLFENSTPLLSTKYATIVGITLLISTPRLDTCDTEVVTRNMYLAL